MSSTKRLAGKQWAYIRYEILKRDKFTCQACGKRGRMHVDHITPLSEGGSNDAGNLQALCGPCHRLKTAIELASDDRKEWIEYGGALDAECS